MQAPVAPTKPHTWHRVTGDIDDPWAWLRHRDDPDVEPYLTAENVYTDAWFSNHVPTVERVFGEIKSRVQETDLSVPVRKGSWWYASRTVEGESYAIRCRGRSAESATDSVLLDGNVEAKGNDYFELGAFDISPSENLLAWSRDVDGGEVYEMFVRDLTTGENLGDAIENTYYGTAWSADSRWLFYTRPDEQVRPYQVWRHLIGTRQSDDELVFEELDERFEVELDLTRSGEWIVISTRSHTTSAAWLVPADRPTTPPIPVRERTQDVEYSIDHWGDRFLIVTNLDAVDFRVVTAPIANPSMWSEFVAHTAGTRVMQCEAFDGFAVVHEWCDGQPRLRILQPDASGTAMLMPDEPHDVDLDANPEYHTTTIRYSYQSLTCPASVFDYDLSSSASTLLKQTATPGVALDQYVARRIWTVSHDGVRVPIDVVHHVDTPIDGTAPAVLYGYGSYEASMPPWFSVARVSLLDRGWVFALAHPRGGGEMGRRWYLDGKLLNKRNTFLDFVASGRALVESGYAASQRLAIRGGSAGGLLVGAAMVMEPSLFSSVIAEVPFVDVVSTMLDPTLPLTITEWEEWGNPASEPAASYIQSYSPYDNTVAGAYPAVYVTAGFNDPRVSYHEPAKWVAKLRALNYGDRPLLLRTEMGAGHGGPSGRYDAWRDEAKVITFLLATT